MSADMEDDKASEKSACSECAVKDTLYFCPFNSTCETTFKEKDIYDHFETCQSGCLAHYFEPNLSINPFAESDMLFKRYVDDMWQDTRLIRFDNKYFVLKFLWLTKDNQWGSQYCNRHWMWVVGTESDAARYQLYLVLNHGNGAQIKLRAPVYSLNAFSFTYMKQSITPNYVASFTDRAYAQTRVDVEIIKI